MPLDRTVTFKLNEIEHHLKFLYVVYIVKDCAQLKNGGHWTCPTFSFWMLKFIQ